MHAAGPENDRDFNEVVDMLSEKGLRHRHYRHYASSERVGNILAESAIYLTDGSSWNDEFDRERFNAKFSSSRRFGICMSCSTVESIAMWMLYGGRNGEGAMIDFERSSLSEAMEARSFQFGSFDKWGRFSTSCTLERKDIDLKLIDVVYFRLKTGDSDAYELKRFADKETWASVSGYAFNGMQAISKHASWSYEREVRLIATVKKEALGPHPLKVKCMKLPLKLSDDFTKNRVFSSPIARESLYRDSELTGTVDWDYCAGCDYRP